MTGDPDVAAKDAADGAPRGLRSLHQPGGEAAGLQHLDPRLRGNEVRFVMSLGLAARGSARPAAEPEPAGRLVGRHLGQQGRHHGAPARPGAAGGHGGSAACSPQLPPGKVVRTRNIDGDEVLSRRRPRPVVRLDHRSGLPGSVGRQAAADSLLFWGATILLVGGLVIGLAFLFGRSARRGRWRGHNGCGRRAWDAASHSSSAIRAIREINAVNDALRRARHDIDEGSAALRDSEEQLRTAAEAAQFGAHEYDVVHDRTLRSPQFLKILGADEADADGDVRGRPRLRPSRRPRVDPPAQAADPAAERKASTSSSTASAAATGRCAGSWIAAR